MKNKTQIRNFSFALIGIVVMFAVSCKKDADQATPAPPDYPSLASGLYTGNYMYSGVQIPGTAKLTKANDTAVIFDMVISGQVIPPSPPVKASAGSGGSILLHSADAGGIIDGNVFNKTIYFSLTSGTGVVTFTGTKP